MNQETNSAVAVSQEQIDLYMMTFDGLVKKLQSGNFKMPVFWSESWELVKDSVSERTIDGETYYSYEFELLLKVTEFRAYLLKLNIDNASSGDEAIKVVTHISGCKLDYDYSPPEAELFSEGYLCDNFVMESIAEVLNYLEAEFLEEIERQRLAIALVGKEFSSIKEVGQAVAKLECKMYTPAEFKAAMLQGDFSESEKVWSVSAPYSDEFNDYYLKPQEALDMAERYVNDGYEGVCIFRPLIPFVE